MVYKYLLKTYIERHKHIKNKSYFKYKKNKSGAYSSAHLTVAAS